MQGDGAAPASSKEQRQPARLRPRRGFAPVEMTSPSPQVFFYFFFFKFFYLNIFNDFLNFIKTFFDFFMIYL